MILELVFRIHISNKGLGYFKFGYGGHTNSPRMDRLRCLLAMSNGVHVY